LQTEDGGLSYWTSAIFGPDDSICALVAEGRFDGAFANASLFHVPRRELPRVLGALHASLN